MWKLHGSLFFAIERSEMTLSETELAIKTPLIVGTVVLLERSKVMEDYKNLDELIKKTEEALIVMDPNTDDYDKMVETLAKLRDLKPKQEVKKSWRDNIKDLAQPIAMVVCAGIAAIVGVYQTKKISDIEDEGVVTKSKTMSTMSKPKLW